MKLKMLWNLRISLYFGGGKYAFVCGSRCSSETAMKTFHISSGLVKDDEKFVDEPIGHIKLLPLVIVPRAI